MALITVVAATGGLAMLAPVVVAHWGRRAGWLFAAGLSTAALVLAFLYPRDGAAVTAVVPWMAPIDVALRLRLDGLSLLFALLVLVIGAVIMAYSTSYLTQQRPAGYYTLMVGFSAAMLLLVLADDLVVLWVAWELTTLCSYLLILRSGAHARPAATRTLLVTAAGGLCLLAAVALIVVRTGTTHVSAALADPAWATDPVFSGTVAVLVAAAAITKSAQFPFHSWLADAMVAPAPVSAYLHAAAMVKAGIFLLLLFADAAGHAPAWSALLVTTGLITAVMGALFALQRADIKSLLAYSTISQLGLLTAVIGIGTPAAMLAATVHVVAHALFKSAGFMHVGLWERRAGSREVGVLRGLARAMPWDATMVVLAVASMAGLAPMLGFVSKELIFSALLASPGGVVVGWMVALVATAGAALTVAYSARMVVTTLPGAPMAVGPWRDTAAMSVAASLVALAGAGFGLAAWLLDGLVAGAAAVAARTSADQISGVTLWHGITAPLLLSLAAVIGGLLLTWRRAWVQRILARPLFPGSGSQVVQWWHDYTIAVGRRVGDLTRHQRPAFHLVLPAVLIGCASFGVIGLWPGLPATADVRPVDTGLLVLLVFGIITVGRATRRLTAVIATGVVGFAVALWYFTLGASDVALTQLLVEILTVAVMVLVLRRMRPRFPPTRPRRRIAVAVVALAAGVTATLATLAFTGHRGLSPAGEYFLREAAALTGGTNVVNTILVDFRALDTLGELAVVAVAAMAVTALLHARRLARPPDRATARTALAGSDQNAVFLRVTDRLLVPLLLFGSVYALLRGHNAPGGGFIAGLIAAAALVLAYLSAPTDRVPRLALPYVAIAGSGVAVAVATGVLGMADGSFLRPLHADLVGLHLTSALVFDVGVYLAVVGMVLTALNLLGETQRPAAAIPMHVRTPEEAIR